MNETEVGRAGSVAAVLALLALLGGGVLFESIRLQRLDRQTQALQRDLASTQKELGDARAEIQVMQGALAKATKDVRQVGKSVRKQAAEALDVKAVTRRALPSVVTVFCENSQGTGFAIDVGDPPDGYQTAIITNHHVIEDCTFEGTPDPTVQQADIAPKTTLWNWDPVNDLALLFVDADIPVLATARSPEQGDPVVAIGSPYGLDDSVTTGIVSQIYDDFFQTDAVINPGNSGGPLLDRAGRVLGVTTFKLGEQGTNFAVRMRVTCDELLSC